MEKYQAEGDTYRKEETQEPIDYSAPKLSAHVFEDTSVADMAYSQAVQDLIDNEDGVEAQYSMFKFQMIHDGEFYESSPVAQEVCGDAKREDYFAQH